MICCILALAFDYACLGRQVGEGKREGGGWGGWLPFYVVGLAIVAWNTKCVGRC